MQDSRVGVFRQAGVGVKEEEDRAARERRRGVHLARAPARGRNDAVGGAPRELRSAVARAAVDDDHLVALLAQRRERRKRRRDSLRFVQGRHDDRDSGRGLDRTLHPRLQAWNFSAHRSSPCGACALFQFPAAYLLASDSVG